jgi:SAM-dependent methyltransferase
VTGLDLSEDLLAEAKARSPNLPGAPTYLRSDMREIPFFEQFEAVVSLFTSFGYFDDRTDDEKVLEGAARALVPGGRLLLDLPNPAQVRGGSWRRTRRCAARGTSATSGAWTTRRPRARTSASASW